MQEEETKCECCNEHPAVYNIVCEESLATAKVCASCMGSALLLVHDVLKNLPPEHAHQAREVLRSVEVVINEVSSVLMEGVRNRPLEGGRHDNKRTNEEKIPNAL